MTTQRKLIAVALTLEAINKESAREKSIRPGHPSTLHLWWARRPLAACCAVIFARLARPLGAREGGGMNVDLTQLATGRNYVTVMRLT
ncbi:MAG: DUF1156 domain-containing protein [Chloroflexi bacterium]|nr:DUF1156 domain-containing protein [Chloroflexota bacterium]